MVCLDLLCLDLPGSDLSGSKEERVPRIAILISGRGSNMIALADAIDKGLLRASVAFVASDREDAAGLDAARKRKFDTLVLPYQRTGNPSREAAEQVLWDKLCSANVEWLILAGFMRILSGGFVSRMSGRIVNIHPSLLPSFPGAHAIQDALNHGVKVTGVTVHQVDERVDHGPILAQRAVSIEDGETFDSLSIKIHAAEHLLYHETLQLLLRGDV